MTNLYVSHALGDDTLYDGQTRSTPKATLAGAAAVDAADDSIFVKAYHFEEGASSITLPFAGTALLPVRVLCEGIGETGSPPTTVSANANINTTGNTSITITGSVYMYGLSFKASSGASGGTVQLSAGTTFPQSYEQCRFQVGGTGTGGRVHVGVAANSQGSGVNWKDCHVILGGTGQSIALNGGRFRWSGGTYTYTGAAGTPNNLFTASQTTVGRSCFATIEGVDFSALTPTFNLVGTADPGARIVFRNCKLPANWSGDLYNNPTPGARVEMHNCDSDSDLSTGASNHRLWVVMEAGFIRFESVQVRTGGFSLDGMPLSWKMATNSNATLVARLESPEMPPVWNTVAGAPVTVTVEILHDSLTDLTDADVWLEVQCPGAADSPIAQFASDGLATVLSVPAAQDTSAATWVTTGMTNPRKQKLAVTVSPAASGWIQGRVMLVKPNTTVQVDPVMTVA